MIPQQWRPPTLPFPCSSHLPLPPAPPPFPVRGVYKRKKVGAPCVNGFAGG